MSYQTHSPAEWAAVLSLATGMYFAGSVPVLLYGTTPPQWLVHAGHNVNRAYASTRHELAPVAAYAWHVLFTARETARDAAALLLMLTTIPTGDIR